MALVVCPECKKQVSDSASLCPHCGFPISDVYGGKLFVRSQLIATRYVDEITVTFNGQTQKIENGQSYTFTVPPDENVHTASIKCQKFLYSAEFAVQIKAGERKQVTVIYDNRVFLNRWKCNVRSV